MSKPKVILFDCDGVLIRYPHDFIAELEQTGLVRARDVLRRFNSEADEAMRKGDGAGIPVMLERYLAELGWGKSALEFLEEQLSYTKKYVDEKLLGEIKKLRAAGTRCSLATNQNRYRAQFILNDLGLKEHFDDLYLSCEIGCRKNEPEFWEYVLDDMREKARIVSGWEVVYFDDGQENIDMASQFGLQSFLFTNIIQFERDMNMLGFNMTLNKF
jgi:putative hydrolase of the HAD superfamily